MRKTLQKAAPQSEAVENIPAPIPSSLPHAAGFIDEAQILQRVPVSKRTWGYWKAQGIVPFIRIGRRVLYDWPSVQAALMRRQRGEGVNP